MSYYLVQCFWPNFEDCDLSAATYPKRLIEVDLPIARISAHARREKSIRHGHISTLHIWWARRPLAACRAVICAALWPDPVDELCPLAFREAAVLARLHCRLRQLGQLDGAGVFGDESASDRRGARGVERCELSTPPPMPPPHRAYLGGLYTTFSRLRFRTRCGCNLRSRTFPQASHSLSP